MNADTPPARGADGSNTTAIPLILGLAVPAGALYLLLGSSGDLRETPLLLLTAHVALLAAMVLGWLAVRRRPARRAAAIAAALAFRLLAAVGEPALSDDVHRYVWDGRVQLHGVHPYRYAPDDPALVELRDEGWSRINHPELRTIYPPLAELLFLALAAVGAGPLGFKLALGLIDFGVVLALARLLRVLELPADRVLLYAWNPLAVLETAGSGHVEPLGVLLVLLAAAWTVECRPARAALALGGAAHAKLLPLLLVPGYLRRFRNREILLLLLVGVALLLPYALSGPALGAGLFDYAGRWRHNAFVFAGIEGLLERLDTGERLQPWIATLERRVGGGLVPWETIYRWAWPAPLARGVVGALLLGWLVRLTVKRGLDAARESFLVFAGALVLAPTLHPWYVLWVLPFAAAYLSRPWLVFGALVMLTYTTGPGDVPWWLRAIEYVPLFALLAWEVRRGTFYVASRPAPPVASG